MTPAPRRPHTVTRPWLIWVIMGLCIAIETALVAGDRGWLAYPRLRLTAYEYGGFWPGLLAGWPANYPAQPYIMFVTYAFLHAGIAHLVVNMVTLWSLGREVQNRVGTKGLALLYLAAILGGALGFVLLADRINPMVGASGGLFGLAGGVLAWNYVDRFTTERRLWPVGQAVGMLVLLNLVMWWAMDGILAWETHLGGFVGGWVAAFLIDPRGQPAPPVSENTDEDDAPEGPSTP